MVPGTATENTTPEVSEERTILFDVQYVGEPRHSWGEQFTRLENTPSGCAQSERPCLNPGCGMVKITVHPPDARTRPWREWRGRDGVQVQLEATPPCVARETE